MKQQKVKFRKEWKEYANTLCDDERQKFLNAVETYAVEGKFPQGLPPEVENYFFTKVVPQLGQVRNMVKEYPKFRWMPEWADYYAKIKDCGDWMRELAFCDAIMLYGCYAIYDELLNPEDKAYFDMQVVPELNRQHKRLEEGKEI